jgi:hypothetical protein
MKGNYNITMEDKSIWSIPIDLIAISRAEHYKHEFENNIQRSLDEDTIPLFESDTYEIKDWARNCMNWDDVSHLAEMISPPPIEIDFQEGWLNGHVEINL